MSLAARQGYTGNPMIGMDTFVEHVLALPFEFRAFLTALIAGMMGSFINMAMWRIPRRESIIWPRSHCPACKHVLGVQDLIPVLSYLALKGRCAYCQTPFGSRYFWIEVLVILLHLLAFLVFEWSKAFFFCSALIFFLVLVASVRLQPSLDKGLLSRKAFTFIEVMMALVIVASIIIPFGNIFISSYSRVLRNKEYMIGYNLLESKMEELKLIPFSELKSDYALYAKPPRRQDSIFSDEITGFYHELREKEDQFEKGFSDVYTAKVHLPEVPHKKFLEVYKDYYGFPYEFYPEGYEHFKRTVKVERMKPQVSPKFGRGIERESSLCKITVTVWIDSPILNKKLELSMYRHK